MAYSETYNAEYLAEARAEESLLYRKFIKARDTFVREWRFRHRVRRFRGESALTGKKFNKDAYINREGRYRNGKGGKLGRLEQEYLYALDAYIDAYASRKGERKARALKARLVIQAIHMERTNSLLHWVGRTVKFGIKITGAGWVGRKSFELLRDSKVAKVLALGALIAAAAVYGPQILAAIAAITAVKAIATGAAITARIGLGYVAPHLLSHSSYLQEHTDTFADIYYYLRWLSWATAAGIGAEIGFDAFGTGLQEKVMGALHMKSPGETVRQVTRGMIDYKRGVPTFMKLDHANDVALETALQNAESSPAQSDTVFNALMSRLYDLESKKNLILDTADNKSLIAEGVAHLKRLQLLDEAAARVGEKSVKKGNLLTQAAADLPAERERVQEWIEEFDSAAAEGGDERHKNILALGVEYMNMKPGGTVPPLSAFFDHDPNIEDLPLTSGRVTAEAFRMSEDAIRLHLQYTNMVVKHYEHVIGSHSDDLVYGNLLSARSKYQELLRQLEHLRPEFKHMSPRHVVADGATADLSDALLLQRIRDMDFSVYESGWKSVVDAENLARSIPDGSTYVNGHIVSLRDLVTFKVDAHSDGLSPYMGHILQVEFARLDAHGVKAWITEGFDLSYDGHISQCHQNGTCVDFATAFTGKNIYEVFHTLGPDAKRLLLEGTTPEQTQSFHYALKGYLEGAFNMSSKDAERWIAAHAHIETKTNATAANFHYEPKEGMPTEIIPASVLN